MKTLKTAAVFFCLFLLSGVFLSAARATEKKPFLNLFFKFASGPEDHYFVVDKKKLLGTIGKHFRIEKYFCLPYDETSSPHQSAWIYPARKLAHNLMPESLQEEQVVLAVKE